jgi:hypothetical protein
VKSDKIKALALAKECYAMKLELLTNATVVDDAIRFVFDRSKEKLKRSSSQINENEKEESNEPDSNEDEGLEEKREEDTGEITSATITTNQVF